MKRQIGLLLALAAFLFAGTALADGAIVFVPFQGVKKTAVPEQVERLMGEEGYSKTDIEVDLKAGDPQSAYLTEAIRHNIRAFILGYTEVSRGGWKSVVSVRSGHNGAVVGRIETTAAWYPGLQKKLDASLGAKLAKALERAKPPGESAGGGVSSSAGSASGSSSDDEAADDEAADDEAADDEEDNASLQDDDETPFEEETSDDDDDDEEEEDAEPFVGDGTPAFELDVSFEAQMRQWRTFEYLLGSGSLSIQHDASLVGPHVHGTVYPVAFFSNSFWRHVGVEGSFFRSFGGVTAAFDGPSTVPVDFTTLSQDWYLGAKIRVPLGSAQLGLHGGIGAQELTIQDTPALSFLPDVSYSFARIAASASATFSGLSIGLNGGLRLVSTAGEELGQVQFAEWFPSTTTSALELGGKIAYALTPAWSIGVHGSYVKYSLTFNQDALEVAQARPFATQALIPFGVPQATRAIAQSATDVFAGGGIGITYHFLP